ncbi:MAG: hypothetical protein FWG64_07610 [Firmicutes bacterium]|nr:hypothetical protein [Bacillota bacterium]
MDYSQIKQVDNDVVLYNIQHFNLSEVLDCGQCFRFSQREPNHYSGIAHNRLLDVILQNDNLIIKNTSLADFYSIWEDYFDLKRNYSELRKLYASDETLKKATEFSNGLRIMKQEPWEMLISYIFSQNCNIPRIKGMIEKLCTNFGEPLQNQNKNQNGYKFPTPQKLANLTVDDLSPIKAGYRAAYIIDAAKKVNSGELNLYTLQNMSTQNIRNELLKVKGVGPKVADCVLLFGFGKTEVYPIDVWIKRVIAKYYPNGFSKIPDYAATAGIAQQFLFHYERSHSK